MHLRAFLVAFVFLFAACDCGGGGPALIGEPCSTASDCEMGLECVDLRCEQTIGSDGGPVADRGVDVAVDTRMMCEPMERPCGGECCSGSDVCDGTRCCASEEICDGVCCGDGHACIADRCVVSCEADESVCGDGESATCCGAETVCYLGACTTPGADCTRTVDCPEGEYCEVAIGSCLPRSMTGETCEYRPDLETFEMEEKWAWTGDPEIYPGHNQVMMAPMVANLTDDNGDGVIDQNDIPDVVFHTFTGSNYWGQFGDQIGGVLRIISGADGSRIFPTEHIVPNPVSTTAGGEVAIADVDPDSPGPEIMACSRSDRATREPGHLMILSAAGALLRRFDTAPNVVPCGFDAPAVGDMNGDGVPEIIVRYVIAHADGTVVQRAREGAGLYTTLANIDDDPDLELVGGLGAYNYDGTAVWVRDGTDGRPSLGNANVAVADLDLDGDPEIVTVGGHMIHAIDAATGDTIWGPFDINPPELMAQWVARPGGGGPITIANFDDDPAPEIAFAGGYAYVIFEADGTRKWWYETVDRSSRVTGSSIFDFEGDGVAEVLYNDERTFRVFNGGDGSIFHQQCNLSGTLREFPIVVDVDNDDHAEIVLAENNYAFSGECLDGSPASTGIHVFGHPENQWVRTRRIWNQHSYHVTNINEDGTVPTREAENWSSEGLNNFRQNVQPDGLFDAPDLVAQDLSAGQSGCGDELRLSVRVVNEGRASAPAGVPVTFYEVSSGADVAVGRGMTRRALLPGESEIVVSDTPFSLPAGREADIFEFVARINEGGELPGVNECREGNNDVGPVEGHCPSIG